MHQIRAHALHAGFPIVGDLRYGDSALNEKVRKEGINRMMLHARSINFKNLDLNAESETPQSLLKFLVNVMKLLNLNEGFSRLN